MSEQEPPCWIAVGPAADVIKRKKIVIETSNGQVLVMAHDGEFRAMQNLCVHRGRDLSRGVILNDRVICPGHQWAFDLATGFEPIKHESQPCLPTRVTAATVEVDISNWTATVQQPASPQSPAPQPRIG